jgi:broad specificity phosphatase PhoE
MMLVLVPTLMRGRCPPGDTPGETPQQMSDRVDRVIAKVRAIHTKVSAGRDSRVVGLGRVIPEQTLLLCFRREHR